MENINSKNCCISCGRDTRSKSQICSKCMSGIKKHSEKIPQASDKDDIEGLRELFGYTDIGRDCVIKREVEDAIDDMIG